MYQHTEHPDAILFVDDGVYIPVDHGNADYQRYLAWVAEGNAAEPYVAPALVPQAITMRQARLALLAAGQLAAVSAAIDALADPQQREAAQIEWEYATEVRRDNALLQALAPGLGLDSAALDALFVAAAAL